MIKKVMIWVIGLAIGCAFGLGLKRFIDANYTAQMGGSSVSLWIGLALIMATWALIPLGYYFARKVEL